MPFYVAGHTNVTPNGCYVVCVVTPDDQVNKQAKTVIVDHIESIAVPVFCVRSCKGRGMRERIVTINKKTGASGYVGSIGNR